AAGGPRAGGAPRGGGRVGGAADGANSVHAGAVTAVAFAPSGTRIASAGVDGMVRLWWPPPAS
ncbi:WD40 repeat domain-containing protein, partial [Frankia nepalensis]|uniref:WD40 repeat domain-containing protein n=1 Tax=Frankia nepalensis TaxID=1836974 RepID=UPI003969BE92